MAYILLPITGTGTRRNPFRPEIPASLAAVSGLAWTAHIPTDSAGQPTNADCYIWVPSRIVIPGDVTTVARGTARTAMRSRENINTLPMEDLP